MVIFDKNSVKTIAHNKDIESIVNSLPVIIEGKRNRTDNLWDTTLYKESPVFKTHLMQN